MYRLADFFYDVWKYPLDSGYEMICGETDAKVTTDINRMQDTLACYSFTVVISGWLKMLYNGKPITLQQGDLYTYTPGFALTIIEASSDYRGICLVAEEDMTFETPIIRNMIRAAYFPIVQLNEPKLHLTDLQADHLCQSMRNIIKYQESSHLFKADCLRMLYSVFLLDLMSIQEHSIERRPLPERTENLFINFIRLLPENFAEHHDIPFYADKLSITPIYLSRIVKKMTGRTVMDYINQMLIMEASWLLRNSNDSIAQIASRLHFADQASFSKFFQRLKGITPKAYRER